MKKNILLVLLLSLFATASFAETDEVSSNQPTVSAETDEAPKYRSDAELDPNYQPDEEVEEEDEDDPNYQPDEEVEEEDEVEDEK